MPPHYLKQLYQLDFADDEDEIPLAFNQDVDIWQFQQEYETTTKTELSVQQVAKYVFYS